MNFEQSNVISPKRLMGTSFPKPEKGQTIWLYAVVGVVVTMESGVGDKGEWTRYNGDYRARTLIPVGRDKEIRALTAGQLYLPTIGETAFSEKGVGEEGKFFEVAFRVGVTADEKSNGRAVFEWLSEPSQSSPAEALIPLLEEAAKASTEAPKSAAQLVKGGKK